MENIIELEDFRKQISELKLRLDRESTLNEHLLHDSLKQKMSTVQTLVRKVITFGVMGIGAWILIGVRWNLSPWFIAFTCLMLLTSMTAEYLINRMKDDAFTTNLRDTATRLIRMKKMRLRQTLIGGAWLILIWMPWLAYEFSKHLDGRDYLAMIAGAVVGGIIGACIGINILLKMQRANDEMIRQIEEFTK